MFNQGWTPGLDRNRKTRVIPKTVNPSNSNQNPGWNWNRIQCFSRQKYAKNSTLSVINYKSMEFFKIKISIGILKSKIFPFKTKFEGQKLYWNNSFYQINHYTMTHTHILQYHWEPERTRVILFETRVLKKFGFLSTPSAMLLQIVWIMFLAHHFLQKLTKLSKRAKRPFFSKLCTTHASTPKLGMASLSYTIRWGNLLFYEKIRALLHEMWKLLSHYYAIQTKCTCLQQQLLAEFLLTRF